MRSRRSFLPATAHTYAPCLCMAHAYIKDGRKTLGLGSSIVTVMQPAESNRRKARHQRSRSEFCTPVFPFLVQDACDPRDSRTRTRERRRFRWCSFRAITWSSNSRRQFPTQRSSKVTSQNLLGLGGTMIRWAGKRPKNTAPRVEGRFMDGRSIDEIRNELERLMLEQLESLKAQTFGGLSQEELRQQKERLKRIREVSADFLAALKRTAG